MCPAPPQAPRTARSPASILYVIARLSAKRRRVSTSGAGFGGRRSAIGCAPRPSACRGTRSRLHQPQPPRRTKTPPPAPPPPCGKAPPEARASAGRVEGGWGAGRRGCEIAGLREVSLRETRGGRLARTDGAGFPKIRPPPGAEGPGCEPGGPPPCRRRSPLGAPSRGVSGSRTRSRGGGGGGPRRRRSFWPFRVRRSRFLIRPAPRASRPPSPPCADRSARRRS